MGVPLRRSPLHEPAHSFPEGHGQAVFETLGLDCQLLFDLESGHRSKGLQYDQGPSIREAQMSTEPLFGAKRLTPPRLSDPPQWTVFASKKQGFTPTLLLVQNLVNSRSTP